MWGEEVVCKADPRVAGRRGRARKSRAGSGAVFLWARTLLRAAATAYVLP